MNILFLTIGGMDSIEVHGLYPDLLRCFRENGHQIYTVSPYQRRTGLKTELKKENGASMLHVAIGNITKCSIIEKGISTLLIESQFLSAIKKYYSGIKFDLVLYTTPPITFVNVIQYIKKRDNAKTYLLLKDIFPQNAVDLGMMKMKGPKSIVYKYFRYKEKRLYAVSDRIGCMSQANVEYVIKHNPEVLAEKVEICPNCIEVRDMSITSEERISIREKYGIPTDKMIFVYGGNLGKPQGIHFLIDCLKSQMNNEKVFFLVVGSGTEFNKIKSFIDKESPANIKLMQSLPKDDYDKMIAVCDVGMIFLDYSFTIPNFPSRLLAYMQARLPVLACTDPNTDIGKVIETGKFGWWCESNDVEKFSKMVRTKIEVDCCKKGENGYKYLCDNYTAQCGYKIIMKGL